jgi:hypothetical protein
MERDEDNPTVAMGQLRRPRCLDEALEDPHPPPAVTIEKHFTTGEMLGDPAHHRHAVGGRQVRREPLGSTRMVNRAQVVRAAQLRQQIGAVADSPMPT